MVKRPLLVGRVAFNGVDDDHGVQVAKHSRFPHRGPAASGVQLPVALGILGLARGVFSEDVGRRPAGEAARALIGAPALIIADEPTSALDSDARDRFVALLREEVDRSGASLLFVSHEASLASHFSRAIDLAAINRAWTPA